MRNIVLSTIGGLLVGSLGALAYSSLFGDGALVASLQSQLDDAKAALAASQKGRQYNAQEASGASDQIAQLAAANADLQKQVAELKETGTTTSTTVSPEMLASTLRNLMRGGPGQMGQQRMLLLKTRLKLTPGQEAKIKAAMDADGKARRDLMRQWFTNGKIDPAAAASANTLDATLKTTLSGDQLAEYQKVQTDEKTSRADSMASMQVNSMMPLLQLTDSQKDQVYSSLYQVQASAPDPMTMMTDPNALTSLSNQAAATQAALAKVLTPDQMALYQQQLQTGGGGFGGFGGFGGRPRGGGNGGGNTAAAAPAPPPPPPPAQ